MDETPSATSSPYVAMDGARNKAQSCLVTAQLGQSLDGRIATAGGESKYINGSCALDHLHALRAAADAVLVGVGTVVADDPWLSVRRVPGRSPARVVLDPRGRADPRARCFAADGARRMVIRGSQAKSALAPGVEQITLEGEGPFAPARILDGLRRAGFRRVLVEGGARTIGGFLDAGLIDILHVFVSPVILGSGRVGLELSHRHSLASAPRPATRIEVFPDGDVLFECDLRRERRENGPHDASGRSSSLRAVG